MSDTPTSLLTFFGYDYTGPGNRDTTTRYGETNRAGHTTGYTYDDISRLERARILDNDGTELRDCQYTMDDRGNITQESVTGTEVAGGTSSFAYTVASELCWSAPGAQMNDCGSTPNGATSYDYDSAGNMVSASDGWSAGYNLDGQTVQVTPPGRQLCAMAYTANMPNLMRWTQPDPEMGQTSDPMTLNPYGYVGSDPINNTDPTGRAECVNAIGGAVLSSLGLGASTVTLFSSPLTFGLGGVTAVAGYQASSASLILSIDGIRDDC